MIWSRFLIQVHIHNNKQCRSRSVGFFRSQLIWIYTVCKGRAYPRSAGIGLRGLTVCPWYSIISYLRSATQIPFWKGLYTKRNTLLQRVTNLFLLAYAPFQKGNKTIRKVIQLHLNDVENNRHGLDFYYFYNINHNLAYNNENSRISSTVNIWSKLVLILCMISLMNNMNNIG